MEENQLARVCLTMIIICSTLIVVYPFLFQSHILYTPRPLLKEIGIPCNF